MNLKRFVCLRVRFGGKLGCEESDRLLEHIVSW